jgi:GTPase SAR1 family protein
MSGLCVFLVIGEAGKGKSTLIRHFCESTPTKDRERISALAPRVNFKTALPDCGDDTGGVTKDPDFYAVRVDGRDVVLIDMPGMQAGSKTAAKPAELLGLFLAILKQSYLQLNGVLSCVKVGDRFTMGQDFCQQLIAKCSGGEKWDQIVIVGTQKDTYKCGKKAQRKEWTAWQTSFLNTLNNQTNMLNQGVEVEKCILTNVCVDEEEDDPTDVDKLVQEIKSFTGVLHYSPLEDKDIVDMMNTTFGTTLITKEDVKLAHEMDPLEKSFNTAVGLAGGAALGAAAVGAAGAASSATFAGVCMAEAALAGGTITASGSVAIAAAPFAAFAGGVYAASQVSKRISEGGFGSAAQNSHKDAAEFAANRHKEASDFAAREFPEASIFAANRAKEAAEFAANRRREASQMFKKLWG